MCDMTIETDNKFKFTTYFQTNVTQKTYLTVSKYTRELVFILKLF